MVAGRSTRCHCPLSLLCLLSWPEITWSLAACREISPCHSHVMQVAPRAHLPHVHKFSSAADSPLPLPSPSTPSVCACANCCCTMTAPTPLLLCLCSGSAWVHRSSHCSLCYSSCSPCCRYGAAVLPGRPFAWIWGHM